VGNDLVHLMHLPGDLACQISGNALHNEGDMADCGNPQSDGGDTVPEFLGAPSLMEETRSLSFWGLPV
jgi:hypothetical protein